MQPSQRLAIMLIFVAALVVSTGVLIVGLLWVIRPMHWRTVARSFWALSRPEISEISLSHANWRIRVIGAFLAIFGGIFFASMIRTLRWLMSGQW